MTEILTGTNRSAGITYNELLDEDSHPVRDIMRLDSPMEPGPSKVPVERYFSREFHQIHNFYRSNLNKPSHRPVYICLWLQVSQFANTHVQL